MLMSYHGCCGLCYVGFKASCCMNSINVHVPPIHMRHITLITLWCCINWFDLIFEGLCCMAVVVTDPVKLTKSRARSTLVCCCLLSH